MWPVSHVTAFHSNHGVIPAAMENTVRYHKLHTTAYILWTVLRKQAKVWINFAVYSTYLRNKCPQWPYLKKKVTLIIDLFPLWNGISLPNFDSRSCLHWHFSFLCSPSTISPRVCHLNSYVIVCPQLFQIVDQFYGEIPTCQSYTHIKFIKKEKILMVVLLKEYTHTKQIHKPWVRTNRLDHLLASAISICSSHCDPYEAKWWWRTPVM